MHRFRPTLFNLLIFRFRRFFVPALLLGLPIRVMAAVENAATSSHTDTADETRFWPADSLELSSRDEACIVYDTITGQCIIDAAAFNMSAASRRAEKSEARDSVRNKIRNQLLFIRFWSMTGVKKGYDASSEAKDLVRETLDEVEKHYAGINVSKSDSTIRTLYVDYYDRCFAKDTQLMLNVIGTTDSAWADSIYRVIRKADYVDPSRVAITNLATRGDPVAEATENLSWTRIRFSSLPEDLHEKLAGLKIGGFSPPVKTPCGYFIYRFGGRDNTPEIGFEKVKGKLVALYEKHKISFPHTISEREIQSYYNTHRNEFRRIDGRVKIWLVPHIRPEKMPGDRTQNASGQGSSAADTARWSGMIADFANLPEMTAAVVGRLYSTRRARFYQGVPTPFGTAHVLLLDSLASNGWYPVERVSATIASILTKRQMIDYRAREKALAEFIHDRVTAFGYFNTLSNAAAPEAEFSYFLDTMEQNTFAGKKPSVFTVLEQKQLKTQFLFMRASRPYAEWCKRLRFVDYKDAEAGSAIRVRDVK
jgi:hypothetical protein